MRKKFTIDNSQLTIILSLLVFLFSIVHFPLSIPSAYAATSNSNYLCCPTGTVPTTCGGTITCSMSIPGSCTNYSSNPPSCSPTGQVCALYTCSAAGSDCFASTPVQSNIRPACQSYSYPTPAYGYPTPAYGYPTPAYSYPTPAYAYPTPVYNYPTPGYSYPTPAYAYPTPYGYPTPAYVTPPAYLTPAAPPVASCVTQPSNPRATGLVTAADLAGFGNSSGICVAGSKSEFVMSKLPDSSYLKGLYFDQSKSIKTTFTVSGGAIDTQFTNALASPDPYLLANIPSGDLEVDSAAVNPLPNPKTAVVFINDNLIINSNLTYGKNSNAAGLVFVVGGEVTIADTVTEVNAVIIAQGKIFTAGVGCATSSVPSVPLIINGSLISLDQNKTIQFCRKLNNNTSPAEIINYQPKYLVILVPYFSDTIQKWSEISGQ